MSADTRACPCGKMQIKTDISYPEEVRRHYVMYCPNCGVEEGIE